MVIIFVLKVNKGTYSLGPRIIQFDFFERVSGICYDTTSI